MNVIRSFGLLAILVAVTVLVSGCAEEKPASSDDTKSTDTASSSVDDHSGWWCKEHGIPEEVCSMCSSKAAKDFKAKDDWCEEHNRAESQCFICNPGAADKFAKLYEAKYGEKPPAVKE